MSNKYVSFDKAVHAILGFPVRKWLKSRFFCWRNFQVFRNPVPEDKSTSYYMSFIGIRVLLANIKLPLRGISQDVLHNAFCTNQQSRLQWKLAIAYVSLTPTHEVWFLRGGVRFLHGWIEHLCCGVWFLRGRVWFMSGGVSNLWQSFSAVRRRRVCFQTAYILLTARRIHLPKMFSIPSPLFCRWWPDEGHFNRSQSVVTTSLHYSGC